MASILQVLLPEGTRKNILYYLVLPRTVYQCVACRSLLQQVGNAI